VQGATTVQERNVLTVEGEWKVDRFMDYGTMILPMDVTDPNHPKINPVYNFCVKFPIFRIAEARVFKYSR